jgi:hypothetical protein
VELVGEIAENDGIERQSRVQFHVPAASGDDIAVCGEGDTAAPATPELGDDPPAWAVAGARTAGA